MYKNFNTLFQKILVKYVKVDNINQKNMVQLKEI